MRTLRSRCWPWMLAASRAAARAGRIRPSGRPTPRRAPRTARRRRMGSAARKRQGPSVRRRRHERRCEWTAPTKGRLRRPMADRAADRRAAHALTRVPAPSGGVTVGCDKRFLYGVNYAWKNWVADFGGVTAWGQTGVSQNQSGDHDRPSGHEEQWGRRHSLVDASGARRRRSPVRRERDPDRDGRHARGGHPGRSRPRRPGGGPLQFHDFLLRRLRAERDGQRRDAPRDEPESSRTTPSAPR